MRGDRVKGRLRYNITSDQDLKDARDRRAQFGHNSGAKVISIAR
jgi:hypothetical protein